MILGNEISCFSCGGFDGDFLERPFFSIVMPAYGVREYIAEAITCVLAQSFSDWELIVVDDCSTDGSGDVACSFARSDPRIRVVRHDENKGLSGARNTGIAESRGVYLWMPDPDDLYDRSLLADVRGIMREHDCALDVVMFGYGEDYYDSEGRFIYSNEMPLSPGLYIEPGEWHGFVIDFEKSTHYGYAWNKIYRLERVKSLSLKFESVRLIEDILFNVSFFQEAESLAVLPGAPYRYAKRRGRSLTNANAYSSEEYYVLHRCRTEALKRQLESWNVFDPRSREILGSLYGRYTLSALERDWCSSEGLSLGRRLERCECIFGDPLFAELIPSARADGFALGFCLGALRTRKTLLCVLAGGVMHFVHEHFYSVFTRLRSGR